ncbi:anti-anti-sigma factor family protein [Francisella philomiragia subsp. philomiragia ATCC 25015]|uniref:STAS domain-containing protein n=1 Tax=Francisella philomiragia TaxID=28110 RepID=UPI0001AF771A|nr:STAS domain-containing protein [Francisella philomiragia]AJI75514.1 anti-anti-sigma factor family protein [Francisella philomiragia subsp. philomiragia ATCC 25015]MBK2238987.1 STAS domain-containing protein [Francisella philomiragia]
MLEITFSNEENNALIIYLDGELNSASCNKFNETIKELSIDKKNNLIFDFSKLSYLSSAGLRSLIIVFKDLSFDNKKMLILKPSSLVREVLRVSGFIKLIPVYENFEEVKDQLK